MILAENREMLHGFRQGERHALQVVYDAYANRVAAFLRGGFSFRSKGKLYAFKGVRCPSELQDLLQESFCRAFSPKSRQAYDGIHPYGAYLLTITRNLMIDNFRRNVKEVYEPIDGDKDIGESGPPDIGGGAPRNPETELLSSEMSELIRAFCRKLSAEEQKILRVYFLGEDGQRQAADELSLTRHQLRKKIARIRKRLQHEMVKSGYLERVGDGVTVNNLSMIMLIIASELAASASPRRRG